MRKLRDEFIPEHAKRTYTYEEDLQEVLLEGWAPNMVEEIIRGRRKQRAYYNRILRGREYYRQNKDVLQARANIRNARKTQGLAYSSADVQEMSRLNHCEAQARYRENKRSLLAEKERIRRARAKSAMGANASVG